MAKDEKSWVRDVVVPQLHRLGFCRVDITHGPLEAGRDIVFAGYDRFAVLQYYAAQAKDGDINARSETNELRSIIGQLENAYETPYRDPSTGTEHKICSVYLLVKGSITDAARNILYAKTGGWLSIVDLSQLEVASLINTSVSDDSRRLLIARAQLEIMSNLEVLEGFSEALEASFGIGNSISLPVRPLRTRSLYAYLDLAFSELHFSDITALQTLIDIGETVNWILAKIPLGAVDSRLHQLTNESLKKQILLYRKGVAAIDELLNKILDVERPAPGERLDQCLSDKEISSFLVSTE